MNIILAMAISPNGLMAREDGSEDWLPAENWYDFLAQSKSVQNIVMGRETFELVTGLYPDYNFANVDVPHKLIVTRNAEYLPPDGYTVVHSPEEAVEYIKSKDCTKLLLIGGGKLNSAFIERNLVTHIHLTVTPYIIGKGRPFIAPNDFDVQLELEASKVLSKDRVLLKYKVM